MNKKTAAHSVQRLVPAVTVTDRSGLDGPERPVPAEGAGSREDDIPTTCMRCGGEIGVPYELCMACEWHIAAEWDRLNQSDEPAPGGNEGGSPERPPRFNGETK
jgi:hypothetical protein